VSGRRARAGARAAEAALWVAVVLAGAYVLLPAAVDLVQTREQEAAETAVADGMEDVLREDQYTLRSFSSDPQAGEKIREQRARDARRVEEPETVPEEEY
jgi:hypothetical protein